MTNVTGTTFGDTKTRSVLIDSDLSGKEGYFVTFDATDDNVVNLAAAATAVHLPLVEGKLGSSSSVQTGTIAYGGRCKILLAATIAAGTYVMSDGNGKAIAATNGKYSPGFLAVGGVSGDIVEMVVAPTVWSTVS